MKMPNTLAKVNAIISDAGSQVKDFSVEMLRDAEKGYYLRVHLLLESGENHWFDSDECAPLLEQAALANGLEVLH